MEKEEGEMSDDNEMLVDEEPIPVVNKNDCILRYKADKSGIIVEALEKIDAAKLEERAKRFGLNLTGSRVVTQSQIDELYAKSGIESGNERHFRFDSLHLQGVEGLTTREIFEYLEDYKPVALEWVDDSSCNVVCQDHISAALALLVHSREIKDEELKKILGEKSEHHWREGMPHPKKDLILLRFATNSDKKVPKKKPERMHTDEYDDQSMDPISKDPWGDLCKSWGVYEHQEVFTRTLPKNDYEDDIGENKEPPKIKNKRLAMRLGKRSEKDDSDSDSEWKRKSKTPRMRMHADDEETKIKKKKHIEHYSDEEIVERKPFSRKKHNEKFAHLSVEVLNTRSDYTPRQTTKLSDKFNFRNRSAPNRDGIRSRLGVKVEPDNEDDSSSDDDSSSSDDDDHGVSSKVQKVQKKQTTDRDIPSVWSRLDYATNKEDRTHSRDGNHSDLRRMLRSRKHNKPDDVGERPRKADDLRERISKVKKTNLRIEIDNI